MKEQEIPNFVTSSVRSNKKDFSDVPGELQLLGVDVYIE